jgi:hypothetical protein
MYLDLGYFQLTAGLLGHKSRNHLSSETPRALCDLISLLSNPGTWGIRGYIPFVKGTGIKQQHGVTQLPGEDRFEATC